MITIKRKNCINFDVHHAILAMWLLATIFCPLTAGQMGLQWEFCVEWSYDAL